MSDCGRRRTRPVANGADYTPYEGLEITGRPLTTILHGRFVVRDGKLVGGKCDGRQSRKAFRAHVTFGKFVGY